MNFSHFFRIVLRWGISQRNLGWCATCSFSRYCFPGIGTFWYGHTIEFYYIQRSDRVHIWLNLLLLLCIVFIPFSASLIGQDGKFHSASVIYGLNLLLAGVVRYWHWRYSTRDHRLLDPDVEPRLIRAIGRVFLIVPFAYLFAIAVSLLNTRIGLLLYAIIPAFYIRQVRGSVIPTLLAPQSQEGLD